jgi:hypothetical protein
MKISVKSNPKTKTKCYNAEAVNKAIAASNRYGKRIGGKEAKLIHRLLQGRVTPVKKNPSPPPIKKQRALTNDDLWSAVRGLGMFRKNTDQLIYLYNEHKDKEAFASKVIAEAAKQVAITKGAKFVRK